MSDEIRKRELRGLQEDVSRATLPDEGRVVESAPAKEPKTPGEWIRLNLFSGPFNSILTIVAAVFLVFLVFQAFGFVFLNSDWRVIQVRMKGYMVGSFPIDEVWRVWSSLYLVTALAGFSAGDSVRLPRGRSLVGGVIAAVVATVIVVYTTQTGLVRLLAAAIPALFLASNVVGRLVPPKTMRRIRTWGWVLIFPAIMIVIRGFDGVAPNEWEGLFFNLIAAAVGIFASFPIGIALAIGRRSELPAIRGFSVVVIEVFRGVPLVAWLIFSRFIVDLLLPPQLDLPDIIKAFVVMTMFSAAYIAEIVRGGIQGVHSGQYEAARALGLPTTRMMALIVLPQALRATIPALIGHFISLFKDTALFSAIAVTELLDAAMRLGLEFQGQDAQTLVFAALIFWTIAFSMSRWSQRLELRLGVGER
ncbi:MAG TPA: amino acid ABC transporter permease [Actinomycetota bacterium]|nr:amino acid ABC transporter permease [Actinomycetota bacterium]